MSCFKLIGLPVLEKKIFEGFYIYGYMAILVTNTISKIYVPFSQEGSTLKLALIGQAFSEMFESYGHIHVYRPGAVADNTLGSFFCKKHKSSVNLVMFCKFFPIERLCNNHLPH